MLSHITCIRVIFWDVCFHMCSQIAFWPDAKSQKLQMCKISRLWFPNAFSNRLLEQMQSHNSCRCAKFLYYMIFKRLLKSPDWTDAKSLSCMCVVSQMLVFMCLLKSPAWIDAKSQQLQICEISPLNNFQSLSQIAWLNRCKVTLVACVLSLKC